MLTGTAEAISPTRIAAPSASPAHQFFNVVRDLIKRTTYHTEGEALDALSAVSAYEKQVITAGDLRQVSTDNDPAPVEDVSQRKAPNQAAPQHTAVAPIDYNQLAAALIAAQQAAQGVTSQ